MAAARPWTGSDLQYLRHGLTPGLTGWADAWLGEELQAAGLVGVELRSAEVGWSVARTRSAPRARGHGSGHHCSAEVGLWRVWGR